jgi:competence protein ComEC
VAGLPVRVLSPPGRGAGNEASVALLVGRPAGRILVPGDLERHGEHVLLRSAESLVAEALVVAHHGSRHGTSDAFLGRVKPHLALISVGRRNPFGHPHRELLRRLRRLRIPILRTDEMGTLRLRAEETGWRLLKRSKAE